jgi:hypothetical protein
MASLLQGPNAVLFLFFVASSKVVAARVEPLVVFISDGVICQKDTSVCECHASYVTYLLTLSFAL